MNYRVLIQNRKSVRAFTDRYVSFDHMDQIKTYHRNSVRRLLPEVKTELRMFGLDARAVLEGAAGYQQFLVGSPQYMVLLSEQHPFAGENAGFVMQDLLLKVTEMGLDSCWLTFTDSEYVKTALEIESDLDVVAIAAFGYGEKTTRRLRWNVRSMSSLDSKAQRQYFQPKKGISELVFLEEWGSRSGVEEHIGFYDDMLWEAFYAASLSPSYLNRQAYGFLLHNGLVSLISTPDTYNTPIDSQLSLGIALLHFTAVAQELSANICRRFGRDAGQVDLP